MKLSPIVMSVAGLMLVACGPQPTQVITAPAAPMYQTAPAPVIVQQPNNGVADFATGALIGSMIGGGRSSTTVVQQAPPTVVNRSTTIINKTYAASVPAPAVASAPTPAPRTSSPAPSYKPSSPSFSGKR